MLAQRREIQKRLRNPVKQQKIGFNANSVLKCDVLDLNVEKMGRRLSYVHKYSPRDLRSIDECFSVRHSTHRNHFSAAVSRRRFAVNLRNYPRYSVFSRQVKAARDHRDPVASCRRCSSDLRSLLESDSATPTSAVAVGAGDF